MGANGPRHGVSPVAAKTKQYLQTVSPPLRSDLSFVNLPNTCCISLSVLLMASPEVCAVNALYAQGVLLPE